MIGSQIPIRCVLMRGGTSKAVFLRARDLPSDPARRDAVILALFGSPDPRQIDGLGGADILTSKVAVIGPPTRPDADLDYTFGQVSIREPVVDYDINCGNISAAVGVYAVEEGLVHVREPVTPVRVHNTNTGKVFVAHVPVQDGSPAIEGECVVEGVPGSGAEIVLDFTGTVGASTGSLLPTGRVRDRLPVPALGRTVEATILDVANLCVFVTAADVGMTGQEGPAEFTPAHLQALVAVKEAAAHLVGLSPEGLVPLPVAVAPPASFRTIAGETVAADRIHLLARMAGGRPPVLHKAYPGTAAACTAVAVMMAGTVPAAVARTPAADGTVVIGHPSGAMLARARLRQGAGWVVEQAGYSRTARRLMEGYAFVRAAVLAASPARAWSSPGGAGEPEASPGEAVAGSEGEAFPSTETIRKFSSGEAG
ncbi:MAG: PrpF domain-containing protein [Armatimonadota bacterium]|nr:PrpF domain-containing protein [Armatimonadota bacterium]MDR7427560.1 PrpF domain-containing protein [Armatimonadota bacterium]MDR7539451.1 PrpF domain-containing protein [Armatimonadota bacterium]